MDTCADYKETLVLDVHGELTPEERNVWERHLAVCEDCRQKRERLFALIQSAKEGLTVSSLSSEEEQILSNSVQRTLRMHKPDARSNRLVWLLAPACAACMVFFVVGWFSLRGPGRVATHSGRAPEENISTNEELLENMDMLQEMESLDQLVNLLDKKNPETSLLERESDKNHVRTHV